MDQFFQGNDKQVSVFDYQNYRFFLHDLINEKKLVDSDFTHRAIARELGISSTGFVANVLSGRSNLTSSQVASLKNILKLKKPDGDYFEALVFFTQAKTLDEKRMYYSKMEKLQRSKFKRLDEKQFSLFAKWHYAVIRELIYFYDCGDDFKGLAKMLIPQITAKEAQEALAQLEEIGLIEKKGNGYIQKKGIVTTGDEIKSFHVANFQKETMQAAQKALDWAPAEERDISVLTMKLSDEKMKEIKSEIQAFRKKLLRMAEGDTNQTRVYQCNINFFPVTHKGGVQ